MNRPRSLPQHSVVAVGVVSPMRPVASLLRSAGLSRLPLGRADIDELAERLSDDHPAFLAWLSDEFGLIPDDCLKLAKAHIPTGR
eukprot:CAMPEP_0174727128 /NCGR_PEP_ID=MMETSP1094-20130205/49148_1 /TAXON_ID=156173 /ORGANISM="Chrysochromulina brevifilum, Strain UTEX LB 985" /LENGTH=84 /DNA_ID=CAMNT_0015928811 /DNA_START=164 /DNA_END=415 /DNA_ORIENTATION=-